MLKQLILSHFSYAQQRVLRSPWWHLFSKDLRIAQNIFFVGYELNDFEPASYLSANPDLAGKTHFILRPTDSPVKVSRLREYGARHNFASKGFADECRNTKTGERPAHANALQSFRYFDIMKDKKPAIKPSVLEIQSLFSFGKFNFQRLLSTYPDSEYVLTRKSQIDQIEGHIKSSKSIIIHSKIGNGKTIFCNTMSLFLATKGYECFELKENVTPLEFEIDFIRNQAKATVIFPNYESAYNNIHLFSKMQDNFVTVIQMQTSTLQVRNSEVSQNLPGPISRVNLNRFNSDDFKEIYRMLDNAGIGSSDLKSKFSGGGEFRDLVVSVFNHKGIVDKIDKLVLPLIARSDAKFVLMCSSILKIFGVATDPAFLRSVVQVDVFQALHEAGEEVHELVDFSYDSVEPHSALLSLFLVQRYLKAHEISAAVFRMASEAARIMNEDPHPQSERVRSARATLGALLRFSALDDILVNHADRTSHITDVYENGRRDIYIQGEPLFWLQYSILMQNTGEWPIAEKHMETAYKRGGEREGFLTYQLDTNSLGLYIEMEMMEDSHKAISRNEKILDRLNIINLMIGEGNHRGHALRVLSNVEKFINKRKVAILNSNSDSYLRYIDLIVRQLDSIPAEDRVFLDSESVKLSLLRAKNALLS